MFLLLSVHYVFNLEYDTCVLEPLLFLQEFVAGIKDTSIKYSALFSSVTSRMTHHVALLVPLSGSIDPVVDRRGFTGSAKDRL